MKELIDQVNIYADLLRKGSIWQDTGEILAPILGNQTTKKAEDNYVYEFYCYLCMIVDLRENYDMKFIKGEGNFKFKFPQAAANKKGKPRFHAFSDNKIVFQVCAGTKIKSEFESENNHPDISFQIPEASEDPDQDDLIIIMDAKYKEGKKAVLPRGEVYKFGFILSLYQINPTPKIFIKFNKLANFFGNCLITNASAYSNSKNLKMLKFAKAKEIEKFYPHTRHNVIG